AGADAFEKRLAYGELLADQVVERDAPGDQVATQCPGREREGVFEFTFDQREFLIGPARIAPIAGAVGVAVASDPAAFDEVRALQGTARFAGARRNEYPRYVGDCRWLLFVRHKPSS